MVHRNALKLVLLAALPWILPAHATAQEGDEAGTPVSADEANGPPPPAEFLGYPVGADFHLAPWDTVATYLATAAAASPYLRVDTLGRTTLERPFILVTATAPANMERLEEIRADQARLADPRTLSDDDLNGLLEQQPSVVLIAHNIHSTEIASSQGVMELAYDLVSDDELRGYLDDVIVLLVPSVNPDGQQMVVEWYRRTVGTPYEGSNLPWLYHHYVGHDNNRDWFMLTQVETQLVNDLLYERWFPEVVYDVHQMGNGGARFFVPPFDEPANPNLDPLVVRMISLFGLQISADLEAAGKPGVINSQGFDLWWHGGLRTAPARHNMIGILSEAASARLASPVFQEPDDLESQPDRSIAYPDPWPGGWWRLRDIVDYQMIAARSVIGLAARQRRALISNFVEMGRRAVEAGASDPPYAYVIPAEQRDPGSTAAMLEILRRGGVEVHRATATFTADGIQHTAGSWVVRMDQPYRAHAKDLLERQLYPDLRLYPEGPPDTPYDATGWTLPLQMGVESIEVRAPFEADLELVSGPIGPPAGHIDGNGSTYLLDNHSNAANLAVHRVLAAGDSVVLLTRPLEAAGRSWPVGSIALSGPAVGATLGELAQTEGLSARAFSGPVNGRRVLPPRVGLYQSWTASMDEGWTRWVFDTWDVAYTTVQDAELRAGDLRERYDVLILPDLSAEAIVEGRRRGTVPAEYAGGLGDVGTAAIREFVDEGGTLICLDSSSDFAIEALDLPVRNVRPSAAERRSGETFYAPGSILAAEIDSGHPLGFGMPAHTAIYYDNSAIFETERGGKRVAVVARYPDEDQLLSGYALHADFLRGKASLLEVARGAGRVVLFGFRPQHRGQTHETFKLLFNAVYRGGLEPAEEAEG
jgi:hypothetical protein